jgi:CRISPR system Cascade subunit CasD
MSGLILRLAGPLQSWGERSAFSPVRDTAPFPTRSALTGLFAAAEGITRHDTKALEHYRPLRFTVRVDRPGTPLVDYHTVGGGLPKSRTAATSGGSNKGAAVITRRHYLSDAVFVVAVAGGEQTIARLARALRHPHWAPYLGRRACVPDEPFVLRSQTEDPVDELRSSVPLSRTLPRGTPQDGTIRVPFLYEEPPPIRAGDTRRQHDTVDVNDVPLSFAPHARAHGTRTLHRVEEPVPQHLAVQPDETLSGRLITYARTEEHA